MSDELRALLIHTSEQLERCGQHPELLASIETDLELLLDEREALIAERDELRKLLVEHRRALSCGNLHHGKRDQHGPLDACPVEARIDAALKRARC